MLDITKSLGGVVRVVDLLKGLLVDGHVLEEHVGGVELVKVDDLTIEGESQGTVVVVVVDAGARVLLVLLVLLVLALLLVVGADNGVDGEGGALLAAHGEHQAVGEAALLVVLVDVELSLSLEGGLYLLVDLVEGRVVAHGGGELLGGAVDDVLAGHD